jgi:hypothetical protein
MARLRCNLPSGQANNHWHSVDAYCQERAESISHSLFPTKTANTSFIAIRILSYHVLPKIQNQQLSTLRWCSFSCWGREGIAICLAYEGGQWFHMMACNHSEVWLPRRHDQYMLMLCCGRFSRWGRECVGLMLRIKMANTSIMYEHNRNNGLITRFT